MSRIEAGNYTGRAIAGSEQYGTTSGGHDQIVLTLELTETGEQVSTFLVFSDKSAPFAMQRLRALGWTGTNLADLAGIDRNEVPVNVRYEEYKGEMKMKVEIVTAGGVVLADQLDDKAKKAFAAKYANLAKLTPATGTRPGPAKAAPQSSRQAAPVAETAESDIPF